MTSVGLGDGAHLQTYLRFWRAMLVECDLIGSGLLDDWEGRLSEHFRAQTAAGTLQWFVAVENGRIVGTCAAFLSAVRANILRDVTATLAGVYVLPAYRRRGIARRLTELAIAWCRQRGCKRIRLNAAPAARSLYESLGFVTATEMMRLDL